MEKTPMKTIQLVARDSSGHEFSRQGFDAGQTVDAERIMKARNNAEQGYGTSIRWGIEEAEPETAAEAIERAVQDPKVGDEWAEG
jgi:hypothetical protein